jgi:hypothetical protein
VIYADATGSRQQTSGTSDLEILRNRFRQGNFKVPTSNPAVKDRVALMNAKLESAAGERRMRIHSRCKELIKDLETVGYKPNSMVIDKDHDPKRTHLSDALGYLVWQEGRGGLGVGERGKRLL